MNNLIKPMISYHNNSMIKENILLQLQEHYDADEIVKGIYWQNGKGCAVGCTIYGDNHNEYESRFGIPRKLAYLEDLIFENLPNALAKKWPIRFMKSIPVGKDLSKVSIQFLYDILVHPAFGIYQFIKPSSKQAKLTLKIASLYKNLLQNTPVSKKQWHAIYAAATHASAVARVYDTAAAARAAYYAAITNNDDAYASAVARAADDYAAAAHAIYENKKEHYWIQISDHLISLLENLENSNE